MLLEAGFVALFFAPPGWRPGLGYNHPPSRASLFLLQWEWFRIYFESGLVKLLSGDTEWRHLTAMDEYYQNGPLPTWIGWYIQHLPHWFHWATAFSTLALELVIVWMLFLPRRWRVICFLIVTPWEIGVIFTANYTFLNYLVLTLGFLLLDDRFFSRWVPVAPPPAQEQPPRRVLTAFGIAGSAVLLTLVGYVTTVELISMVFGRLPLPMQPVTMLDPFRIANQYGLFAVMTRGRYEIEFQGSNDGVNWAPYAFRFKPQALDQAPGIYAPYQPRFEWNLWFASLGNWQQNDLLFPGNRGRPACRPARRYFRCSGGESLSWCAATICQDRSLVAILVYLDEAKAHHRRLVDPPATWASTPPFWSATPWVELPSSLCPTSCLPTIKAG